MIFASCREQSLGLLVIGGQHQGGFDISDGHVEQHILDAYGLKTDFGLMDIAASCGLLVQ
jgi:hypothetical protein